MKKLTLIFTIFFSYAFCCTTTISTKGATQDGSIIISHSDDDEIGDQRIVYVPSKKHNKGSKRAIYPNQTQNFPRYVGKSTAPAYNIKGYPPTQPLGYVDQAKETYAYFVGNYGIINEHQLAFGECTNSTYYYFDMDKDKRIMGISELSQIALERCKYAKEAIKLMGALAEEYGYYGYGETLLVGDKNEAWVFEISCTPEGTSAIWVAKKVPDGEVFAAANQFRIQKIDPENQDNLYSSNLFDLAKKHNWKNPNDKFLNWQKAVCPGEFDHPYYSLRRVWRVFDLINPSMKLSPWIEGPYTSYYPFSIKPEKKLTIKDLMKIHKDHYEETEFDLTKGLAAGPYGSPNRYLGKYDRINFPNKQKTPLKGAWERSISIYYTGYTYITQIRDFLPDPIGGVTWIGYDDPHLTCFIPFYIGMETLPDSFQYGNPQVFDRSFAWWAFNLCSNWTAYFYYAVKDLKEKQNELQDYLFEKQKEIENQAAYIYNRSYVKTKKYLTNECLKNAEYIVDEWWNLLDFLISKYRDGFINIPTVGEYVGYPEWYLDEVGYQKGPTTYEKNK